MFRILQVRMSVEVHMYILYPAGKDMGLGMRPRVVINLIWLSKHGLLERVSGNG